MGNANVQHAMDISRPDIKKKKQRQLFVWVGVGVLVLAAAGFAVSGLKPAAPTVDASAVGPDTVKGGDFTRNGRGWVALLVPREDAIMLIPALTDATVVHIRELPGAIVKPDTILMDLSDPELDQKLLDAQLAVKGAEADSKSQQAILQSTLMDKKTAAAAVNADYTQDQLQAQTDKALFDLGVISGLTYQKSKGTADQLE